MTETETSASRGPSDEGLEELVGYDVDEDRMRRNAGKHLQSCTLNAESRRLRAMGCTCTLGKALLDKGDSQ